MKKIVIILLLLPFITVAQNGFSIDGRLKASKDSIIVKLIDASSGKEITKSVVLNNHFVLKGKLDDYSLCILTVPGFSSGVELFIGNENISVEQQKENDENSFTVSGCKYQGDYKNFTSSIEYFKRVIPELGKTIEKESQGKKRDSLITVFNNERQALQNQLIKFAEKNASSPVSTYSLLLNAQLANSIEGLDQQYAALQKEAKQGIFSKIIEKLLAESKVGAVGTMAIDFTQKDTANHPVKLSSFRGKYVLVDFWASWCGPCRMENPNVVAAYHTYKNKNFTVLSVSLDSQKENWLKAIKDDKLVWTHVSDLKYWSNEVAQLYHVQSIPQNFLVDPTGKIIAKDLRGEELKNKLKSLLN